MKIRCPECDDNIAVSDINIGEAVFLCRHCNEVFPLSGQKLETEYIPDDFALDNPPQGVTLEDGFDGKIISASVRNYGGILFALFFASMFTGIPGTIAFKGDLLEKEGIFGLLFLLPFFTVGFFAMCACLIMLLGKTEVVLGEGLCRAFTGIGSIGWKKEFMVSEIAGVYKRECGKSNGRPMYHIVMEMESGREVKFGMFINNKRLDYMFNAIKTVLKDLQY